MVIYRNLLKIQIVGLLFLMVGCNSNTALVPPSPKPTATASATIAPLEWNPSTQSYQRADEQKNESQKVEKPSNVDANSYPYRTYDSSSNYTSNKQYTKEEIKTNAENAMIQLCATQQKPNAPYYRDCKKKGL